MAALDGVEPDAAKLLGYFDPEPLQAGEKAPFAVAAGGGVLRAEDRADPAVSELRQQAGREFPAA